MNVSTTTGSNFNRYWYANNNPYKYTDPDGRCATRTDDGSCVVGIDSSLVGNAEAEGQRQMLQNQLNVIDPIIRATPDSASAEVMTNSYDHLGTITGAELKTLWNNQDWTIVPDGSSNNGGFGRTYQGLTELEVSATKKYSDSATDFGLPRGTGLNTLIFHEIGHITGAGLRVQRKYSGARPGTERFDAREGKTSTIGSASARMVGVPFSCDVGVCR